MGICGCSATQDGKSQMGIILFLPKSWGRITATVENVENVRLQPRYTFLPVPQQNVSSDEECRGHCCVWPHRNCDELSPHVCSPCVPTNNFHVSTHKEIKEDGGPATAVTNSADSPDQFSDRESFYWDTVSRVDWYTGSLRYAGNTFVTALSRHVFQHTTFPRIQTAENRIHTDLRNNLLKLWHKVVKHSV
jgi:hypothetical protein